MVFYNCSAKLSAPAFLNGNAMHEQLEALAANFPGDVLDYAAPLGEPTIVVTVLDYLKTNPAWQCQQLMDACGVDYPSRPERFAVVYNLLSVTHNHRVRVKTYTDAATPVPSVIGVYPSAGWWEREAWDMFGITFSGHPDLRRILTDYGFEGHPLRKDFPLTGYVEVRYDPERRQVVYEPVALPQDYRTFDFLSPWEGAHAAVQQQP
jgi:NADH-quinone oxidoreductase subunit C